MVDFVEGSIVASSYGDLEVTSASLTISSLALEENDRFYIFYHYRNTQAVDIAAPVWNGQTADVLTTRFAADGEFYVSAFRIVASATATANMTALVLGNNAPGQFTYLLSTRFIVRGAVAATPEVQLQTLAKLSSWTAPSLSFTGIESGDLLINLLATTAFNSGFTILGSTWSPSNLTQESSVTNAGTANIKHQYLGSYQTSGDIVTGWTPSTGQPGYANIGFIIKAASASASIVNINGDNTVVQGSAGNTLVTTLLTVSTLAISDIPVTLTAVDGNNHTWTQPGFVDGQAYAFGTVVASVNSGEAIINVTLSADPAYTARTMGTLSTADDSIYTLALAQGLTIATDDVLYNSAGLTTYDDSTISDADDGTHIIWHRDHTTNMMTQINLLVAGGVIVSVGLTLRALTARSLTLRSLTARAV